MCAAFSTHRPDPEILELLLRGKSDTETSELRACVHLANRDLERASILFFGNDGRVRSVPELFVRFLKFAKTRFRASLQIITTRMLYKQERLGDRDNLDIVTNLVEDKDFCYSTVSMVIWRIIGQNPTPNFSCELLEMISAAPLDRDRQPHHLYDSIIGLIQHVLHSAQKEQLVSRLQAAIAGCEAKNELLADNRALRDPIVVRFLLESCGCDPNVKNQNGKTALHVLDSISGWEYENRKTTKVAQILLQNGAHPCSRNAWGMSAFRFLHRLGFSVGVRTLQCIAASKMAEAGIIYRRFLPKNIHKFTELHY